MSIGILQHRYCERYCIVMAVGGDGYSLCFGGGIVIKLILILVGYFHSVLFTYSL